MVNTVIGISYVTTYNHANFNLGTFHTDSCLLIRAKFGTRDNRHSVYAICQISALSVLLLLLGVPNFIWGAKKQKYDQLLNYWNWYSVVLYPTPFASEGQISHARQDTQSIIHSHAKFYWDQGKNPETRYFQLNVVGIMMQQRWMQVHNYKCSPIQCYQMSSLAQTLLLNSVTDTQTKKTSNFLCPLYLALWLGEIQTIFAPAKCFRMWHTDLQPGGAKSFDKMHSQLCTSISMVHGMAHSPYKVCKRCTMDRLLYEMTFIFRKCIKYSVHGSNTSTNAVKLPNLEVTPPCQISPPPPGCIVLPPQGNPKLPKLFKIPECVCVC